jgi:predicted RNA-binding Zn-ribbon protein involved in translation (DUF1610 family)
MIKSTEKIIKYKYKGQLINRIYIKEACSNCGKVIWRHKYSHRKSDKRWCSKKCRTILISRENNPRWKGGKSVNKHGNEYKYSYLPDHPNNSGGYIPEHRVVMEKKIGRILKRSEIVHHIDGDTTNNAEYNLFLTDIPGHNKIHNRIMKILKELMNKGYIKFNENKADYEVL